MRRRASAYRESDYSALIAGVCLLGCLVLGFIAAVLWR
jgi:hypothetical protein